MRLTVCLLVVVEYSLNRMENLHEELLGPLRLEHGGQGGKQTEDGQDRERSLGLDREKEKRA